MKNQFVTNVEGDDTLMQFAFDEAGLIGQIDLYTMKRFQIENQTITPKEDLLLTDKKGNPIDGLVFMRGNIIYVYNGEEIYKRVLKSNTFK